MTGGRQAPAALPREAVEGLAVAWIKRECEKRILEAAPYWRQVNHIRRGLELIGRSIGGRDALPPIDRIEAEAIDALADWTDRSRLFSDALEDSLGELTDEELLAFNPTAADWPLAPGT